MGSDYRENVIRILQCLGGADNVASVTCCMTRLRVVVKDEGKVDGEALRALEDVMSLVHGRPRCYEIVVGPGRSRKYAELCGEFGIAGASAGENGGERREGKRAGIRGALKIVGDIFVPLIPGTITAGLCAGLASLIPQLVPDCDLSRGWSLLVQVLSLLHASFMTYITAWAGYRAGERFGATPILGGMLGMITSLEGINRISVLLGLYNEQSPLNSVLRTGKGGVLAVIAGVYLLSVVERKIRSKMPESVDVIFTPLLSLLLCVVPYILAVMPLFGWVSNGLVWVSTSLCMSENLFVKIIAGYLSTALFLPLVAAGMHHGLVAFYTVQLQELGYITLYPALATAGSGQVGAAIALWIKAKRAGNRRLCSVIAGGLPAGVLGIGEPLIYGVTLPLGKPFVTAGLGAGFGGALVMAMDVAATTWGVSGLLGVFVMTAGPLGAVRSVLVYLAGLVIACVCGFVFTWLAFDGRELLPEQEAGAAEKNEGGGKPRRFVRHGESIFPGETDTRFHHRVADPAGMHARPAGLLAELVKKYDCEVTLSLEGRSAPADSVLGLMNLGAVRGSVLTVTAEGNEAREAAAAVKEYLRQNL